MENFITTDLVLATVLSYFGENLSDTNKNEKGEIEFIFSKTTDLEQLVKSFALDELTVSPRRFSIVLKDMKKILYTQKIN